MVWVGDKLAAYGGVGELTIIGPTTTVEDGSRVDDHVNSHMGEQQGDERNDIRGGFL